MHNMQNMQKKYAHTHQVYTHTLFLYDTHNKYMIEYAKKYAEYAHTPFSIQVF
jgi:hypothetical protein